jgi:glycosyltransferase involved in cell wall biosynthesis
MSSNLTVLLPVFNCEKYIAESIESILSQSFGGFVLKIINDGSVDGTCEIIEKYRKLDDRIIAIHKKNEGLSRSLNQAVLEVNTQYIARQDADDISDIDRLSIQVQFLKDNADIDLVGSWTHIISENGSMREGHKHPTDALSLDIYGLFDTRFVHSSVVFKRDAIIQAGNYSTSAFRNPPEDFDLWLRVLRNSNCANINKPLLIYRELQGSISRKKDKMISDRVSIIAAENIFDLLGGVISFDHIYFYVLEKRGLKKPEILFNKTSKKIESLLIAIFSNKHAVNSCKVSDIFNEI